MFYDKKELQKQINLDFKFKRNINIVQKEIFLKRIDKLNLKISLIKIDVNGHELSVVKGLKNIIKKDIIKKTNAKKIMHFIRGTLWRRPCAR